MAGSPRLLPVEDAMRYPRTEHPRIEPELYHVHGIEQEFECPMCGQVVEDGDHAFDLGHDVVCSRACAAQYAIGRPGEV